MPTIRILYLLTIIVESTSVTCTIIIFILVHDYGTSYRSEIDDDGQQIQYSYHLHPPSDGEGPRGKIVNMAQLLVMMVELTSETWYELVNSQVTHCEVLYRT